MSEKADAIMIIKTTIHRIWESPVIMSWGVVAARMLSLVILMPLILASFTVQDVVIWQLFATILTLQLIVDMGFMPTFARIIAYSMSGVSVNDFSTIKQLKQSTHQSRPNWQGIKKITQAMKYVYLGLVIFSFLITAIFGTWAISNPLNASSFPSQAWSAWVVIIFSAMIQLYGNAYIAFLQGVNKIAILQRWQMLFSLFSLVTSTVIILSGGGLLELVIGYQFWPVLNVVVNMRIKSRLLGVNTSCVLTHEDFKQIKHVIWPSVWRSGIGVLMSVGVIQMSGIIYANMAEASEVASYLLGLQVIRAIANFSQAPFYSKIPLLAKHYAQRNIDDLLILAKQGMQFSYAVYVVGFILAGFFTQWFLDIIDSNVPFLDTLSWSILGLAIFFERYGAMHIHLYSSSNHIIWHIANGVSGVMMILFSVLFYSVLKVLTFPVAILLGYLGFYGWYAAIHSYKEFDLDFYNFEKRVALPALLILLLGIMVMFWI